MRNVPNFHCTTACTQSDTNIVRNKYSATVMITITHYFIFLALYRCFSFTKCMI
jgi:hypothetical protein